MDLFHPSVPDAGAARSQCNNALLHCCGCHRLFWSASTRVNAGAAASLWTTGVVTAAATAEIRQRIGDRFFRRKWVPLESSPAVFGALAAQ